LVLSSAAGIKAGLIAIRQARVASYYSAITKIERNLRYVANCELVAIARALRVSPGRLLKACRYEPDLNPGYQELAAHYGTVVIPARAREPTDKAKVEAAVQHVERRILAALRDRKFFSLGEVAVEW
jgi:hypothetical protein